MRSSRRMLPDIDRLQTFEAAARHLSFTRAALELDLTQSAVSRQIRELETQLGLVLFTRVRQRIVLSSAGRKFLPLARGLLQQAEDMMIETVAAAQATSIFSIAAMPVFLTRWLIPRLPSFTTREAGISLNLVARDEPFDLSAAAIDVAIHYGAPAWPNASCRPLFSEAVVPVASPLLLRQADLGGLSGLEVVGRAPLLHLAERPRDWALWFRHMMDGMPQRQGHRLDHLPALIRAAVAGLGVALAPKSLIEDELLAGALLILSEAQLPTQSGYYFVTPDQEAQNPLTERFYHWITAQVSLEMRWNSL